MTMIKFLGTKGEIEESSRRHRYNSSLLVASGGFRLLIDHGLVHKQALDEIKPHAVLITHAHPDHYIWLKEDIRTDIPVYLTKESLEYGKFRPGNYTIIEPGRPFRTGPFGVLPYRVIHSIRCPAVGFRIKTPEGKTLVYNPDLVDIVNKEEILKGVDYYIGDGSAVRANLVRKRGPWIFGHTRIVTQINWCRAMGIRNTIFTHIGRETMKKEAEFRREHPEAALAYDGMEIILKSG